MLALSKPNNTRGETMKEQRSSGLVKMWTLSLLPCTEKGNAGLMFSELMFEVEIIF